MIVLFKKNGHVAQKCVSAKMIIVKKIKRVSSSGLVDSIIKYINGNIKGNFTNINSAFK
jgi:hypothetical protein